VPLFKKVVSSTMHFDVGLYLRQNLIKSNAMAFINIESLNEKEVFPGYVGKGVHTGTTTHMYWKIEAGAAVPEHSHMQEQVAHVLKGVFELTVNGETALLEPGKVAVIPPNVKHSGQAVTYCELLDIFYPEREDYKF
jgi:quercetin dioxygenase-like cupin family protein